MSEAKPNNHGMLGRASPDPTYLLPPDKTDRELIGEALTERHEKWRWSFTWIRTCFSTSWQRGSLSASSPRESGAWPSRAPYHWHYFSALHVAVEVLVTRNPDDFPRVRAGRPDPHRVSGHTIHPVNQGPGMTFCGAPPWRKALWAPTSRKPPASVHAANAPGDSCGVILATGLEYPLKRA